MTGGRGGRWMLGPVSNEDQGAGLGIRCVCTLSLVSRVCAAAGAVGGVMCGMWWCSGAVSAARVNGLCGGPLQLQDVWMCLLEVVEGAQEASLDAGHVLFREVGIVFGGDVWARPVGFTRIGEEERRDGEAIALHKTHIWANSLKPVCFLCFLLFWSPLLPFIETGTLKIYTKMVLYMKNEIFDLKYPLHGV